MKLAELISNVGSLPEGCDASSADPLCNPEINAITCRSQDIAPGGLFVAVKGFAADGHAYIGQAVESGASAVVCERPVDVNAAIVTVENSRKALAELAAVFYGHPSKDM
ncbi:MAG: Mur ligase domain-containing protein, partial [Exilibacterium sp.]